MKKLTYLVASLLTTATVGMIFTGCIDNDEPYGIEQLRGAKAELLKSKKALIEADAQYKLALAEAEKVKAAAEAAKIDAMGEWTIYFIKQRKLHCFCIHWFSV